jgi:L-threonylcarbamoyladenylate synthase
MRRSVPLLQEAAHQLAMPGAAADYAHALYAALRTLDQARDDIILVEALPTGAEWQGINDRLRRAAHDSSGVLARLLAGQPPTV